jgi:hypothetical protein
MKAKRAGPGRPSKLTPEAMEKLIGALRAGNFRGPAAFYAGIGERTLATWMREGKERPAGPYGALRQAVLEAERGAEIANVAHIAKAAQKGDWKAAAWWLERKANERWGRPERKPPPATDDVSKMSDAELRARVRELMAQEEGNAPSSGRTQ